MQTFYDASRRHSQDRPCRPVRLSLNNAAALRAEAPRRHVTASMTSRRCVITADDDV